MKKIIFLLVLLVIATSVMTYLYFSRVNSAKTANDQAISAAATQAAMVFEFNSDRNFYQLIQTQSLFSNFLDTTLTAELENAAATLFENEDLYTLIAGRKVFCSVVTEEKQPALLFSMQLNAEVTDIDLDAALTKNKLKIVEERIFRWESKDSSALFIGFKDGLILMSASKPLIKSRLNAVQKDLSFEKYINDAPATDNNRLMTLYINFKKWPDLLNTFIAGKLDGELFNLANHDGFAALSYNFSKDKLLFNGATTAPKNGYYSLFADQQSAPFTIQNILPATTANYNIFLFNKFSEFIPQLDDHFTRQKRADQVKQTFSSLQQTYLVDIRSLFSKYTSNQFMTFQLKTGEKLGAVALTNGDGVRRVLNDMGTPYNDAISIFKEEGLMFGLFGDPFFKFKRPFFTVKGNYLVFANNASTVQSFINAYDNDSLLVKEGYYIAFNNQFPGAGNISSFISLVNSRDIFRQYIKLPYYKHFRSDRGLGKYDSFCYQLTGDKGNFQTNMVLAKEKEPDTTSIN